MRNGAGDGNRAAVRVVKCLGSISYLALPERTMYRRTFVGAGIAGAAAATLPAWSAARGIKALAFDGLALFDPRPIFVLAEQFFPGKSASLVATWRGRQFDYTWLRTIVGSYVDFLQVTDEALSFAADAEKISVTFISMTTYFRDSK